MTRTWLIIVGSVIGALLFGGGYIIASTGASARRHAAINGCEFANLPNGYIRLVLELNPEFDPRKRGVPSPEDALPILSCVETVDTGRLTRLEPEEERRYLRTLTKSRLPIVRDGVVVGSEPLPAPRRP